MTGMSVIRIVSIFASKTARVAQTLTDGRNPCSTNRLTPLRCCSKVSHCQGRKALIKPAKGRLLSS
jgi:hypothetical protein